MWRFDANSDIAIDSFAAVVEADTPSKGSWQADFEAFCTKYNVIPCPQIKSAAVGADKESCRVLNAIIDISNWRAMLLAACTTGSKVIDITVHGCRLSAQHLSDLATALRKSATIQSVKLQHLDWNNGGINETNITQYQEALTAVLADSACLEAVSLNGNNFSHALMAPVLSSLMQSFKLISLNLANNQLTDETVRTFIKATRCTTNVKFISFANNKVSGDCLQPLAELLNGTEQSGDDDATFKANSKLIGEKNKAIKELNKKRKKANQPDVKEINPSLDVAIKREKTLYLVNRTLKRVDLSGNADMNVEKVRAFAQAIAEAPQGLTLPQAAATYQVETDPKLVVDFARCGVQAADGVNGAPQPWIELIL